MKPDRFARRLLAALVLVLLFLPALPARTVQAANESWTVVSLWQVSCAHGDIIFITQLSNITFPTNLRFRLLVDAGSIRYMDKDAGTPGSGNGEYS